MNRLRYLCLAFAVTAAGQAFAWGPQGHRMVGYIADGDLTPTAKAAVQKIMNNPSLSSVATWMDDVRDDPQLGPKMKEWHFDDVPVCNTEPAPCKDGNCAHAQIDAALETLRTAKDIDQQLNGLRVLVHLVGDIHQPLHSSDNHDAGGNFVTLANRTQCRNYKTKQSKACNLHQYWDSVLIRNEIGKTSEADFAKALATKTTLPAGDSLVPTNWITQSNMLGRDVAYGKLDGFACGNAGKFATNASQDYDAEARQAINQQLALAGHRLAALLNDIYK